MKKRRNKRKQEIKEKRHGKTTYLHVNKLSFIKRPTFIFITSLTLIITLIPTFIVILPTTKEEAAIEETNEEVIETPEQVEETIVPVMRTKSETVEQVPLEQYVMRVVASEMPAEFELEALKAQALAARTFVIDQLMNGSKDEENVVLDSVDHQVYYNENELRELFGTDYSWKMGKIEEAVLETKSEILTYNDHPITPAFFSTSNGYTENSEDYWESELPYLRSVTSKWDEASPKFLSQHTFTIREAENLLDTSLAATTTQSIEMSRTESNRVKTVMLGDKQFTGREVREKLNLPSNDFSIERRNDHFIFTTKGYGHGVGMSQYGANGMAAEGKSYEEIVSYYYKDVSIHNMVDIAPKLVMKE